MFLGLLVNKLSIDSNDSIITGGENELVNRQDLEEAVVYSLLHWWSIRFKIRHLFQSVCACLKDRGSSDAEYLIILNIEGYYWLEGSRVALGQSCWKRACIPETQFIALFSAPFCPRKVVIQPMWKYSHHIPRMGIVNVENHPRMLLQRAYKSRREASRYGIALGMAAE